ncbi:SPOR domain-containing protein [Teredinibacter sp. KSP-S5-2]|uniref:SPOR domain-containing protein n=1 Tax=Teredinibacter sp. KSP-S5-2 TaxID=3034506 RepID=UPI002934FC5E|nr:SPOR domain-containing protein [Teredinibacter sp. KSP-S5-2]WNO10259.1 SPOR domain-containing protein [Teredinibacter sp. KSP-S5-2]
MESLTVNKNDLRVILILVAVIPLTCFITGFLMAQPFSQPVIISDGQNTVTSATKQQNAPAIELEEELVAIQQTMPENEDVDILSAELVSTAAEEKTQLAELTETTPVAENTHFYTVQAGVFSKVSNANKLVSRLNDKGINCEVISDRINDNLRFKVILGIFESKQDAIDYAKAMQTSHQVDLYATELDPSRSKAFFAAL